MKFNRAEFDPIGNRDHQKILTRLRIVGSKRLRWYLTGRGENQIHYSRHYSCCASSSLQTADIHSGKISKGIYLDLGCGNSADYILAALWGYDAYGIDLFEPTHGFDLIAEKGTFIKGDVVERLPFDDDSVVMATCHAMLDLVEPERRPDVYREAFRVLADGGYFAVNISSLGCGHGFDIQSERTSLIRAGFDYVKGYGGFSCLMRKPHKGAGK